MKKIVSYRLMFIATIIIIYLLVGFVASRKVDAFSIHHNTSINPDDNVSLSKFKYAHRYATGYHIKDRILEDLYYALDNRRLLQDDFSVLMGATIDIESRWDRFALAPSGYDVGLFQLNYRTRKSICNVKSRYPNNKYHVNKINIKDFDIETNLDCYIKINNKMKLYYKLTKHKKFRHININNKLNNKYSYAHHVWYNPKRQLRINKIEKYIVKYNKGELLYDLGLPLVLEKIKYRNKTRVFRLCGDKCKEKHFTKNDFNANNKVRDVKKTGGRYETNIKNYIEETFRNLYRRTANI